MRAVPRQRRPDEADHVRALGACRMCSVDARHVDQCRQWPGRGLVKAPKGKHVSPVWNPLSASGIRCHIFVHLPHRLMLTASPVIKDLKMRILVPVNMPATPRHHRLLLRRGL